MGDLLIARKGIRGKERVLGHPEVVCSTFHFLGLQAVSPFLVLIKVWGGSTPVKQRLSCFALGAMPTLYLLSSLQAGFLGQNKGQNPWTPDPCSNPHWGILPGSGAWPALVDTFVVQLPMVLEGEVAGLPSDSKNCRNDTLPENFPRAQWSRLYLTGPSWKKVRPLKISLCAQDSILLKKLDSGIR